MAPRRVLHLITRMIVGGAQEMVLLLGQMLDRERFETHVACGPQTGPEGDLGPELRAAGVVVHRIPDLVREPAPLRDRRALEQIRQLLRREKFDIVHTHTAKAGVLGRYAARKEGVPVVVHHVHSWSFTPEHNLVLRAAFCAVERWAARWCDALCVVTPVDMRRGLRLGIGREEQYVLIRSAIDLGRFPRATAEAREAARGKLGIGAQEVVVGLFGRLSPQKAPLDFVRAAQLLAGRPEMRFVIVGDGPLRQAVERAAADLARAGRLAMLGLRRDIGRLLPALDIYVNAALWEGLPRGVLEAMAVGLPVVATDVGGVAEVVEDGVTGRLVRPGRPRELAQAIAALASDPVLRRRMGELAARRAREFSAERMVRALEGLYLELLRRARERARAA